MKQKNATNFISLENAIKVPEEVEKRRREFHRNLLTGIEGWVAPKLRDRLNENVKEVINFPLTPIGYEERAGYYTKFYYFDSYGAILKITYATTYDEYGGIIRVDRENGQTYTRTIYGADLDTGLRFNRREYEVFNTYPDREIFYVQNYIETGCQYFSIKFKEIDTEFRVSSEKLPIESHIEFALSLEPKYYTSLELYSRLTSFFNKEFEDVSICTSKPVDKRDIYDYCQSRKDWDLKSLYRKERGKVNGYGESFANGDTLIVYKVVGAGDIVWKYIIRGKAIITGDCNPKEEKFTIENVSIKDFCDFNFSEIKKNIDENLEKFLSYL